MTVLRQRYNPSKFIKLLFLLFRDRVVTIRIFASQLGWQLRSREVDAFHDCVQRIPQSMRGGSVLFV